MTSFQYKENELHVEHLPMTKIAAKFGTPAYVYSRNALEKNLKTFQNALQNSPHRICYAVKANSNIAILNLLAKLNAGFDIVSQGELERVLIAGGDPQKIVFSGVGKKTNEIKRALDVNIFCFNVESAPELEKINTIAKQKNKIANIALRVNPNIDARTHPYIATGLHHNKFGIEIDLIPLLLKQIKTMPNLNLIGLACHIGSQLTDLDPFLEALECLLNLISQLQKEIDLRYLNMGGGLGISYRDDKVPSIEEYVTAVRNKLDSRPLELIFEPGRAIVGNAGILLTKVEYVKQNHFKNFAIVDAAMNDFMRSSLYDAWQKIIPVTINSQLEEKTYEIVGPVCESGDFLGKDRKLALQTDDLLVICDAGAYGFAMSSNYNSRPRVAEVLVDGETMHLIRQRESFDDMFVLEKMIK